MNLIKTSVITCAAWVAATTLHAKEADWWNKDWSQRQAITLDGAAIGDKAGESTLLLRLSDGGIFTSAREDGGDLRIIAADGKTVLPHHVERFDPLLGEGYLWVKFPEIKTGKETYYLYFGNANSPAPDKGSAAYGKNLAAVYHFAERGSAPADSTTNANHAAIPATISEGSIIGAGIRLSGTNPVTIPASPSLAWEADKPATISLWTKPASPQPGAVLISRSEGNTSFRLLLENGSPVVEAGTVKSAVGNPLPAGSWSHIAIVSDGGNTRIFVNGEAYGTAAAGLPALNTPVILGESGFNGEIDELRLANTALTPAEIKLGFINQSGSEAAQKLLSAGAAEGGEAGGHSGAMEHMMLFGDIANNMMFDGWIAVGLCVLMIIVGWSVALKKFFYLNSVQRGNVAFLEQWSIISHDLTALDHADQKSVSSFGGNADNDMQELVRMSPFYDIYHIGSEEIRRRLEQDRTHRKGLTGRSIQAIRAALDAGLVRESHKLTDGLIYLTISIAGGPYIGLLGTVVGVMITFAVIAKSGEVDVNSIAPGIASALLATVAGLVVAIPALFIYSYLNSRIKNMVSEMNVFIDEFVAKMAEYYQGTDSSANTESNYAK